MKDIMFAGTRMLYVGTLNENGNCFYRMKVLGKLGIEVTPVNILSEEVRKKQHRFSSRLKRKILGPSDLAGTNKIILQHVKEGSYNLLWIDKGITIKPETLEAVRQLSPETVVAGYSPDDMLNPDNQSRDFFMGLASYHLYFTANPHNVSELKERGCPHVFYVTRGYDSDVHRLVVVSEKDKPTWGGPVGFLGTYEQARACSMLSLAEAGIPVRIWGEGWKGKKWLNHPKLRIEGRPLWGDDFTLAICSFGINLCFLRKINRDVQTTRSVAIPACGGFMLAERTREHERLFQENKEAVFFSSDDELVEKVRYFMEHKREREAIARAGCKRALNYSNYEVMKTMLEKIGRLYPFMLEESAALKQQCEMR